MQKILANCAPFAKFTKVFSLQYFPTYIIGCNITFECSGICKLIHQVVESIICLLLSIYIIARGHTLTYMFTHTHTQMHMHTHRHTQRTHTCTHTHVHTHTHTHTHTQSDRGDSTPRSLSNNILSLIPHRCVINL